MKFKVGHKVKLVGNEMSISFKQYFYGQMGEIISVEKEQLFPYRIKCNGKNTSLRWCDAELEPVVNNQKIVITTDGVKITTAKLYENSKVVKTAEAKCCPEDTFDFNVGAKLVVERLTKVEETPKYYNGKVVCVDNKFNRGPYTIGKIYQFVDGVLTSDNGCKIRKEKPCKSFKDFDNWTGSKFIEVVE